MTLLILISLTPIRAQVDLEAATCSVLDKLNASAMLFGRKAKKATR